MPIADRLKQLKAQQPKPKGNPRILLDPNIPAPLHGLAPRNLLGTTWWRETRATALRQAAGYCAACGHLFSGGYCRAECHERYRVELAKGRMYYLETVAICNLCHSYIHDGRLGALMQQGLVPQAKFVTVVQHGDAVLRQSKLERMPRDRREYLMQYALRYISWANWRLIVFRKHYKPLYKSERAYRNAQELERRKGTQR